MKLLVVGSAPQSNICLRSNYVSAYHAEIILLDNGDIFIVDKNSTNGTSVNGARVTPGIEVPVRRGEQVMFADSPLDWGRVPSLVKDLSAKRLISIGNHNRNQIKLSGSNVSRFHATIKETLDGKWFICDHSTNGTTLNNIRIPKDVYVKLKKGDEIKCAGIPVENPAQGGRSFGKIITIASLSVVVAAAVVLIVCLMPKTDQQIHKKYENSVVLLQTGYHFKVTAGSLDFARLWRLMQGSSVLNEKGEFVYDPQTMDLMPFDGQNSLGAFGTGFFISKKGYIATNLHVVECWRYDDLIQSMTEAFKIWLNTKAVKYDPTWLNYITDVKVEGVLDYVYMTPNNAFYTGSSNAIRCIEVAPSEDTDIDLAILQVTLKGGELPDGVKPINIRSAKNKDDNQIGTHVYTLGFPTVADFIRNFYNKPLCANGSSGSIQNQVSKYTFGHSAIVTGGASGSPMFDKHGRLIGIVESHDANNSNYCHSVKAEYLVYLLENAKINY